jgi:hypothetical protein
VRARDFAGPAYRFLLTEARSLAQLAAPLIVVMVIANFTFGTTGADVELVIFTVNLIAIVVLTQFARVVYGGLLAGRPPELRDLPRIDSRTWSVFRRTLAMAAVAGAPVVGTGLTALVIALASAFGSHRGDEEWIWIIVVPGALATLWLSLRLALVPVIAALPGPLSAFSTSWSLTRGRGWLVFKLLVMIVLPWAVLRGIAITPVEMSEGLGPALPVVYGTIFGVLDLALIAVFGRAFVALYRALTAAAAAAPRSAPAAPAASP